MGGFFKVLRHVAGTSAEQSLSNLKDFLRDDHAAVLALDLNLLDILDRFRTFAHMAPEEFQDLIDKSVDMVRARVEYSGSFSEMKEVRRKAQAWIETIRLLRAVIEIQHASVIDDFDEIAAECQTMFSEFNENILFDAQLGFK